MPAAEVVPGRVELRFPMEPASIARGRRHALDVGAAHLGAERLVDLELLVSEVLTNAVRHGGGDELGVILSREPEVLYVAVTDGGAGFVPAPRAMHADESGGFGLFLVERMTRRWGMTREAGRTRVWFELPRA